MSALSNEQLEKAFERFTPKSDWNRLFDGKVQCSESEISASIEYIRTNRNKVAHCKVFKKEDYIKCNNEIKKINHEIVSAIHITETKDFSDKNYENLMLGLQRIKDSLREFEKNIVPVIQTTVKTISIAWASFAERMGEMVKTFSTTKQLTPVLTAPGESSLDSNEPKGDNEEQANDH